MSTEDINQSLEALHAEINQLDASDSGVDNGVDSAVKEKLIALISNVEKQLQNPEEAEHKNTNLQTLPTLIEQFERDHPKMTSTLSKLLNTLSGMGI